jgi:hypothetical protein
MGKREEEVPMSPNRPLLRSTVPMPVAEAIDAANAVHHHEPWYAVRDAQRELRALGLVGSGERVRAALLVVDRATSLQAGATALLAFDDRLVVVRQVERMRGRPLGGEVDVTVLPRTAIAELRTRRPFLGAAATLVLRTADDRRFAWTLPEDQTGAVLEHFLRASGPAVSPSGRRRAPSWIPSPKAA